MDRLITLAIHTYDHAKKLQSLLEHQGIHATLQNVNLEDPVISPGIRVRISESDLAKALRIIENKDIFLPAAESDVTSESITEILVPVDFTETSFRACRIAFFFAAYHKANLILLNTYLNPVYNLRARLTDALNFDEDTDVSANNEDMKCEAESQMGKLTESLLNDMKEGHLPVVKFSTIITEGIPEEIINQTVKERHPLMIVMGTRGSTSKDRDMVGSVTAEVLDTCRIPVFTIPESVNSLKQESGYRILFMSNFDQQDLLALDAMFSLLPQKQMSVKLIKLPSKKTTGNNALELETLKEYCEQQFPQHEFIVDTISITNIDQDFNRVSDNLNIDLIAIPSKRRNALGRLFNPGVAHKLLFHADIPMIVIPV
ncbi:MAG: universal stress protein [Paramuribaculum sp.]|nr:universal stress protein [Paramuribaculum sp.]